MKKLLTWQSLTLDAPRLFAGKMVNPEREREREDSEEIKAIKKAEIPARIVGHCTSIQAEVVS